MPLTSATRDVGPELNIELEIDVLDDTNCDGTSSSPSSSPLLLNGSYSVLNRSSLSSSVLNGSRMSSSVLNGSHSRTNSVIIVNNSPTSPSAVCIKEEEEEEQEPTDSEEYEDFAEDVNEKLEEETFQCFYCTFVCPQKEALSKHIDREHCRKAFSPLQEKNGVRIIASRPDRSSISLITCKLCPYSSHSQVEVDTHFAQYHCNPTKVLPKEMFHCSECRYTSQIRRAYICHYERLHMQVAFYKCEFCTFSSSNAASRNKHLEDVHKHCSMCDFNTQEASLMEQHVAQEHSKKKGHICTYCEKTLATMEKLDEHVKNSHVQPTKQSFKCLICDFACKMSYDYYEHLSSKHRQELFQCEKCDFNSHLAWQMADHDGTHNIKGYACDRCDYMTTRIMFLRRHLKARHSEKNECCPYCPFKSSQRWCVTQHIIQVHEKSRLFPCEQCEYKATSRGNLNVHIRGVHIRDRRYHCTHCGFKTSLKAGLIKHLKSHNKALGKKPTVLKCKSCDYRASSKQAMIMHRRDNHPLTCDFCDFLTGSLVEFQQHLKLKHLEQVAQVTASSSSVVTPTKK